jgi:hypothetical protein
MGTQRRRLLLIGIGLLVLESVANILAVFFPGPPPFIIWSGLVLGILGLLAVVGLWLRYQWALPLAIVVLVLDVVTAAPGTVLAPNVGIRSIAALLSAVLGIIAIVLLLLRASRPALRPR